MRIAKYLLERGADPNGDDGEGTTSVTLATKYGHPDVVAVLVAAGARPLDQKTEAQIKMIAAAERRDLVVLRRELSRGAGVNDRSPSGERALVAAVRGAFSARDRLLVVQELLQLGANPNLPVRFIAWESISPLHLVVFTTGRNFVKDHGPEIVDALLKAGAHVSSTESPRKQTPLHIAAQMENTAAAGLLLKAGAKVMPRDEDGKTPLDLAESAPMIELLKSHGARE